MGGKLFMDYRFIFARWNLELGIISQTPQNSPVFVSVKIPKNNTEVYNNPLEESHGKRV